MMSLADLLAYDRWANRQYLNVVAGLTPDEFTKPLGGSFGSVRDTLVHLAWAEWIWTERWQGRSPQARPSASDFQTLDAIRAYLAGIEDVQTRLFAAADPDRGSQRIRYTNLKGESWEYAMEQMVHHLTFHSAYHRGQLATFLRQLGAVPPSTDFLIFQDAQQRDGRA
jgi:uncharacterized damage-inducible protein DinB